ncbi:hypothetical protein SISNIDRAFT_318515 [Sistotremastrum niveocremeum HHB9708]|uniref:Major facilitator superfamily MFS-1 n=1 Tax=Sistotremastrum niveocremeum HHB9708 TaxID=1314777 RepID=A0A164N0C5_9AGAM|nr:hypothetical protein SISNIDRAFT_318515 [Sistotremastrum niveocremeum HHB9708]
MGTPRPTYTPIPPRNFTDESALDIGTPSPALSTTERHEPLSRGRVSFGRVHRPSIAGRLRSLRDEERASFSTIDRPPIPTPGNVAQSTPLPMLPLIVLSIAMLGEFLSANVSTPFLLFMVEGFGGFADEAEVGYWTGILVSVFFITQFLTSLLWATVANRHGQRAVLFVSLLGSAVTCSIFGTSTTLQQAVVIRLLQGVFAGSVGVARSNVTIITDPSNEGRAYAILGFCWGLGGVAGAIIGGSFESPAKKWPNVFQPGSFFVKYPYLLPCLIASSITLFGSLLSLFLAYDGGPRTGAIKLPEKDDDRQTVTEVDDPEVSTPTGGIARRLSNKLSGYFSLRAQEAHAGSPAVSPDVQLSSSRPKQRTFSRTSRANGTAYGYDPQAFRRRLASRGSFATRRPSQATVRDPRDPESQEPVEGAIVEQDFNIAQRLLIANEFSVTNIADLWVAAAINAENEDPFETDTDGEEGEEEAVERSQERAAPEEDEGGLAPPGQTPTYSVLSRLPRGQQSSFGASSRDRVSFSSPMRGPPLQRVASGPSTRLSVSAFDGRRPSFSVPAIYSNVGVKTPPAFVDISEQPREDPFLAPISEGQVASLEPTEKPPSAWARLPLMVILQYGLLALHSTTHDQIFLSYLVSPYKAGGLGLNAAHFAQLIALMCLAQIAYQFYLYPNIGPPRGRFSHLAMFRIGSLLFIPAYLTVIIYRAFASPDEDGNILVMTCTLHANGFAMCPFIDLIVLVLALST